MSPQHCYSSGEETLVAGTSVESTSTVCGEENPPFPVIVNVNGFDIPVPIDDLYYKDVDGEGGKTCRFSRDDVTIAVSLYAIALRQLKEAKGEERGGRALRQLTVKHYANLVQSVMDEYEVLEPLSREILDNFAYRYCPEVTALWYVHLVHRDSCVSAEQRDIFIDDLIQKWVTVPTFRFHLELLPTASNWPLYPQHPHDIQDILIPSPSNCTPILFFSTFLNLFLLSTSRVHFKLMTHSPCPQSILPLPGHLAPSFRPLVPMPFPQ